MILCQRIIGHAGIDDGRLPLQRHLTDGVNKLHHLLGSIHVFQQGSERVLGVLELLIVLHRGPLLLCQRIVGRPGVGDSLSALDIHRANRVDELFHFGDRRGQGSIGRLSLLQHVIVAHQSSLGVGQRIVGHTGIVDGPLTAQRDLTDGVDELFHSGRRGGIPLKGAEVGLGLLQHAVIIHQFLLRFRQRVVGLPGGGNRLPAVLRDRPDGVNELLHLAGRLLIFLCLGNVVLCGLGLGGAEQVKGHPVSAGRGILLPGQHNVQRMGAVLQIGLEQQGAVQRLLPIGVNGACQRAVNVYLGHAAVGPH